MREVECRLCVVCRSRETLTDSVAEPFLSDAGVNVNVPDEFTDGARLKRDVLLFDTLTVRLGLL